MDGSMHYSDIRISIREGERVGSDPRQATSEDVREIFSTPQEKSIHGNATSERENLYPAVTERLEHVNTELRLMDRDVRQHDSFEGQLQFQEFKRDIIRWRDSVESRLQVLEKCYSALPGSVTQKELQQKEEFEKLEEENRQLKARNQKLLSEVMSKHKYSEDMNDPSRLSAVLEMYQMLKIREWEKLRSRLPRLTYERGRDLIQKLFGACEKDIERRKTNILEIAGIPYSTYPVNNINQEQMMPAVLKLLRNGYYQHNLGIHSKIPEEAGVGLNDDDVRQFVQECCKVFCLLLLQDPPVKAVWHLNERSLQHIEHVDMKDLKQCKKRAIQVLWPIMKHGEEVVGKGVVWD